MNEGREYLLKMHVSHFFQQSVEFLGHEVSENGVQCCKKHLDAVKDWPKPTNVKELQTFLGFVNFYRRFIPGYASIAEPLYCLLKAEPKPKGSVRKRKKYVAVDWRWDEQQEAAFRKLKELFTAPPILAYPDFDKEFVVHV